MMVNHYLIQRLLYAAALSASNPQRKINQFRTSFGVRNASNLLILPICFQKHERRWVGVRRLTMAYCGYAYCDDPDCISDDEEDFLDDNMEDCGDMSCPICYHKAKPC